jgi:Restriction endonuclease
VRCDEGGRVSPAASKPPMGSICFILGSAYRSGEVTAGLYKVARAKQPGEALQRLVRTIESAMAAGNANIRIEVSKRFPDKITGTPREHDVVLTIAQEHHELVIALECRDRSRPVGVNAVEEFRSKCEHTGINSGIIVSARGFCKTAIQKATYYGIRCLTLDEAKSFDWCPASGVDTFHREMRGAHLNVLFDGDGIKELQLKDGTPVTEDIVRTLALNLLNHHYRPPADEAPGDYHLEFKKLDPQLYGILDGKRVQAVEAQFIVHFTLSVGFTPFSFRTYMDMGRSKQLNQVAMCAVQVGDVEADLVLSHKDGLTTITLVGSPPALPRPSKK